MHYLGALGATDSETLEALQARVSSLQRQLNELIAEGIRIANSFVVGTPEAEAWRRASLERNAEQQAVVQAQLATAQVELDKLVVKVQSAQAAQAASPGYQADQARLENEKLQRQLYLLSQPGKYDFGMGSSRRNVFYKESGVGANVNGLFAMDRPTMGLDVWSIVTKGVKSGIDEYKNDPNKGKLPDVLPSINIQGVSLPSWLTDTAKAVAKPVQKIGGSTYQAYLAARDKDRRDAEAQANAVGSSVPNFNPAPPKQAAMSPLMMLGLLGVGYLAVKSMRSRR